MEKTVLPALKQVPGEKLQELSRKKIFFVHQSVGENILDGVRDVMKENGSVKLQIRETVSPADLAAPVLAHARLGKNENPTSKIDAFADALKQGLGERVDVAAVKLCYIDINAGTDVQKLFEHYRSRMAELRKQYPGVVFLHMTVPLGTVQTGPKVWIKKLIGRQAGGAEANRAREQYNALLRQEYGKREPIYDIALAESTAPDGQRSMFVLDGKPYAALFPGYTTDGGHLNELGRKVAAEQFLIALSGLSR